MLNKLIFMLYLLSLVVASVTPARSTTWEVKGKVGFLNFYAEMDDSQNPVPVLLRLENSALIEALTITPYFVLLTDANRQPSRAVTADEIVSDYLDELRELLPQHQADIDLMLREIQADFPQEKIVKVYATLKAYMADGRPISWRANLENFLLGKNASQKQDVKRAEQLIEAIGTLSKNYLWPGQIAPGESRTGLLYFKRPVKHPAHLYIQVDRDFLGLPFEVKQSGQ